MLPAPLCCLQGLGQPEVASEGGMGVNCDAASSPSPRHPTLLVLGKGKGPGLHFTFERGSLIRCFVMWEA